MAYVVNSTGPDPNQVVYSSGFYDAFYTAPPYYNNYHCPDINCVTSLNSGYQHYLPSDLIEDEPIPVPIQVIIPPETTPVLAPSFVPPKPAPVLTPIIIPESAVAAPRSIVQADIRTAPVTYTSRLNHPPLYKKTDIPWKTAEDKVIVPQPPFRGNDNKVNTLAAMYNKMSEVPPGGPFFPTKRLRHPVPVATVRHPLNVGPARY